MFTIQLVCELVSSGELSQPLLKAYSLLKPFQTLIGSAFLPAACRAYVNLRGSCDQWCKEDFLCPRAVFAAVGIQDGGGAASVRTYNLVELLDVLTCLDICRLDLPYFFDVVGALNN
jgi:hypothetical protein